MSPLLLNSAVGPDARRLEHVVGRELVLRLEREDRDLELQREQSVARQRRRVARRRTAAPTPPRPRGERRVAVDDASSLRRASARCASRFSGCSATPRSSSSIASAIEQREVAQVPSGVAVVDVDQELIELVRRRQRRVEPDRAGLGLAELVPVDVVTSGDVIACASAPSVRRISSIPAVMFPH